MTFEWDETKNAENIAKHDVSFEEAQAAFFDRNRIILKDKKHSMQEDRFFCIGKIENRVITLRFTIRNGNIRIIGAGYWRKGIKIYERNKNL
ncbi:MAG: BrnT family toxin [Tannerella sp.]|jgi:uncharacterized DUF497 family protein|nr:BrnT family toxin [Tannerella sp.]